MHGAMNAAGVRVIRGALAATVAAMMAAPAWGAASTPIKATGHVTGDVRQGTPLVVTVTATHTGGWQDIAEVRVELALRGRPLDSVSVDPTNVSIAIPGSAGPHLLGEAHRMVGSFFVIEGAGVTISARGDRLTLRLPLTLSAEPPPGARLTYRVDGSDVTTTGDRFLTAPVATDRGGFSWGTLGAAVAGALLAGAVLGNTFASSRRKAVRPSVYAAVQRRIEQERGRS
jgi:hypothetical protein